MIRIKGLKKSFGDTVIFNGYDLEVADGEFVILSGNSGCGKTTLINMIGGIEPLDGGEIHVGDYKLERKRPSPSFFQAKVGFVFQNFGLVENKTVRQNLNMVDKKFRSEYTLEETLQAVGMSDKIDEKVYRLSGGEQQRVALARLMLKKCDVILADEPTGSLDWENAKVVIGVLEKLHHMGKTIIMVTHDERLSEYADRVIHLKSARNS